MNPLLLDQDLKAWLEEDIGFGDITTEAIVPPDAVATGLIHTKEAGLVCGLPLAQRVFALLDPTLTFVPMVTEGTAAGDRTVLAKVSGSARSLLTGERLALNLLQHLSGIATYTHKLAQLAAPYGAVVVDTRKTTPGLRQLEKYAVRVGGGRNHRQGLFDAVLVKDNHIQVAGGITQALELAKKHTSHMTKIEIEVETLEGAREALQAGADVIMLDNMAPEQMKACVKELKGKVIIEASGGINENTLAQVAATGVDVISVGALTHSVKALDISMDIGKIK